MGLFLALAGWVASIIAGTDARQGAAANVVVGIIGAFLGGFLNEPDWQTGVTGFNPKSFYGGPSRSRSAAVCIQSCNWSKIAPGAGADVRKKLLTTAS